MAAPKIATAVLEIVTDTSQVKTGLAAIGTTGAALDQKIKAVGSSMSATFSDFGTHVKKVQSLVNDFSGQKAIAEAHAVAKAVQEIGGAQNLTAQQQAKVSGVMEAALKAHKVRGDEAAVSIKGLATATQGASTQSVSWAGSLGKANAMLATFGVGASLAGVVGLGTAILHDTGAIEDLFEATGVSRTGLQQLGYIGKEINVDMGEMGKAVQNLSERLANGDKSAVDAVQGLGLSVKDLIAAGPEETLLQVAEAAGRIEDPMTKGAVASDLFGGKLGKKLIPMLGELRQKMADVPKGDLFSDQDIQDADALGDSLSHLTTKFEAWTLRALRWAKDHPVNILPFEHFEGPTMQQQVDAMPFIDRMNLLGVDRAAGDLNKRTSDVAIPVTPPVALTAADLLNNRLKALRAEAVEPLTAAQKANIVELTKWGQSEGDIAKLVGASETSVHKYVETIKGGAAEIKKWQEAMDDVDAASNGYGATLSTLSVGYQKVIADALKGGASAEHIATAWGLAKEQVDAVAQSMKLHDDLLKLEASDTKASAESLEHLGKSESHEIDLLNQSREARERMNSSRVLDIDLLRSLGHAEDAEIQRLLKLTKIYTDWTTLESEGFRRGTTGLQDVGIPVEPLSKAQQEALDKLHRTQQATAKAFSDISQSLGTLAQVSGKSFGGVVKDIGTTVAALNVARTSVSTLTKSIADGSANFAQYAAAAAGVVSAIAVGISFVVNAVQSANAKQDGYFNTLVDFEKQASDRYNAIRRSIPTAEAAHLTDLLRQAMQLPLDAKHLREMQQIMKEVNDELSHYEALAAEVNSQFGPSHSELQAEEQRAHERFDFMQKAGDYTQDQLNAAYYSWQKALAAAGNAAAAAWVKATDGAKAGSSEALAAMEKDLTDMIQRRDQLQKNVDGEKAEAVMGENEKNDRAELAALDEKLKAKAAEYQELAARTGQQMADAIKEALERLDIHIPITYDAPAAPPVPAPGTDEGRKGGGGSSGGFVYYPPDWTPDFHEDGEPQAAGSYQRLTRPKRFLGGEAGREDVVFGGAGRNLAADVAAELARILPSGGGAGTPIIVESHTNLLLDSHQITRSVVRNVVNDKRGAGTQLRSALVPA